MSLGNVPDLKKPVSMPDLIFLQTEVKITQEVKVTPEVKVTQEGQITATQVKITRSQEVVVEGQWPVAKTVAV